jgi:hypothetical protein
MKAIIFTRKDSVRNSADVKKLLQTLRVNGIALDSYDADTVRGAQLAETYGVMDLPAVVLITEEGKVQGFWQGSLPSEGEISQSVGYI